MDRAGPDAPAVKSEPGSSADEGEGGGGGAPYAAVEILIPGIKQECSQYSGKADQRAEMGYNNVVRRNSLRTAVEADVHTDEASPAESDEGVDDGTACTDVDVSYPDIKQECSEYSRKADLLKMLGSVSAAPPEPLSPAEEEPELKTAVKKSSSRRARTSTRGKVFSCTQCNYSCNRKSNYKSHALSHSAVKLFQCLQCDYSTNRKSDFNVHARKHTGDKLFSCLQCNYSCHRLFDFKRHELTHTGEKPFRCSHCSYSANRKSALNLHVLRHFGEKPFTCSRCNYSCYRKSQLTIHVLTHTGKKLFTCSQCNYSCNWKSNIKKHALTHTGQELFSS